MKLILCKDLRLGAVCTVNLSTEKTREWNVARYRKFEHLLHTVGKEDGGYMILLGKMFGASIIPGDYVQAVNALIGKEAGVHVITSLVEEDSRRLTSIAAQPDNLHVLMSSAVDQYDDDALTIRLEGNNLYIYSKADGSSFSINTDSCRITITGERLPSFEPCGFEDAMTNTFGYMIATFARGGARCELRPSTIYAFRFPKLPITADDTAEMIKAKAQKMAAENDADTFVRLTLTGTTGIGVEVNTEDIADILKDHVFYAEVIDGSSVDLSGYKPETGVSLANEFVRLAMADTTLGEAERARVIRNGWNALYEKEDAHK